MEIKSAFIVKSLAGRDHDRLFVVLGVEPDFALLADGRLRKVQKPKRKKLKHISFVAYPDEKFALKLAQGEKVTNSEIRRMLSLFAASAGLNY
jgi:ribosomal protein L14E/L6E/L27E